MTDRELGWLAGIIDGEGCIAITKQKGGSSSRVNPSYRLYIKVAMGHQGAVEYVKYLAGGGSVHHYPGGNNNDHWVWSLSTRPAARLLALLRPHLVVKAAEADVALRFAEMALAERGGYGGGKAMDISLVNAREALYWELRSLKPRFRFYGKEPPHAEEEIRID